MTFRIRKGFRRGRHFLTRSKIIAKCVATFVMKIPHRCPLDVYLGLPQIWREHSDMKVSVFGLGYVGAVSAACMAQQGHQVIGIDSNQAKVDIVNSGRSPIIEKDIDDLIQSGVDSGRLRASLVAAEGIADSDISFICVGTPSQANGSLDLTYVQRVCESIGEQLRDKTNFHVVVVRSTVLPGTMRNIVIPVLEACSRKRAGFDFGVCHQPEFLREGSAVQDYYHPARTVIGQENSHSGNIVAELYRKQDGELIITSIETAEMVKYTDNVWHALKVGFANEIGDICKKLSIDSHILMNIFCQDMILNLSPYYMKPGLAFGGSCLPKDLRALTHLARAADLDLPILNAILPSNQLQLDRAITLISDKGNKKIGILGFSFKAGTDDLRESPMVEVIERLLGKGYEIRAFDRNVGMARLIGTNRDYILNHLPHISALMAQTVDQVLEHAETIVIGHAETEFADVQYRLREEQVIVDLARISESANPLDSRQYEGICW